MAEAPHFVLYEHAVGYLLFKVKEFEDIGLILPQVFCTINFFIFFSLRFKILLRMFNVFLQLLVFMLLNNFRIPILPWKILQAFLKVC